MPVSIQRPASHRHGLSVARMDASARPRHWESIICGMGWFVCIVTANGACSSDKCVGRVQVVVKEVVDQAQCPNGGLVVQAGFDIDCSEDFEPSEWKTSNLGCRELEVPEKILADPAPLSIVPSISPEIDERISERFLARDHVGVVKLCRKHEGISEVFTHMMCGLSACYHGDGASASRHIRKLDDEGKSRSVEQVCIQEGTKTLNESPL